MVRSVRLVSGFVTYSVVFSSTVAVTWLCMASMDLRHDDSSSWPFILTKMIFKHAHAEKIHPKIFSLFRASVQHYFTASLYIALTVAFINIL